ncbi:MAG TPA: hypothetical protein VFI38_05460 [Candidatus Acidoferrum sp.]|nr:hypothetical protein [Candidatus Acidoferrum sp.]
MDQETLNFVRVGWSGTVELDFLTESFAANDLSELRKGEFGTFGEPVRVLSWGEFHRVWATVVAFSRHPRAKFPWHAVPHWSLPILVVRTGTVTRLG